MVYNNAEKHRVETEINEVGADSHSVYLMHRAKTDDYLIAKEKLPNLAARLGNFSILVD